MGGVTIAGHANDMQNVGGTTTNDEIMKLVCH